MHICIKCMLTCAGLHVKVGRGIVTASKTKPVFLVSAYVKYFYRGYIQAKPITKLMQLSSVPIIPTDTYCLEQGA